MSDIMPPKGPVNQPIDDDDSTAPDQGPIDQPIDDPDEEPSTDNVLEDERTNQNPNESTLKSQPKLSQDYESPATPAGDPVTRNLPSDHPKLDSDIEETQKYQEDETDASEVWSQHESNDRKNDAYLGDNGPDL